ncbi:MAG: AMP-binding protein [Gammaproteobacteria bacterium]|nr:AMP-binding protein [Gammaproteobacteria bacterium]
MPLNANIAADTIGRFAKGDRSDHLALIHENLDGSIEEYTYAELDDLASRFAVYLANLGVQHGEPVAIHTAQSPQTAIAHMAVYKLGAIALTLSHLYRPDAIAHVINDSKAKVIITNSDYWASLRDRLDQVKTLRHRIVFGNTEPGETSFSDCLKTSSEGFEPVITKTEDPALLMYTSGSTGMPKGLIHAHRIIHAYIPSLTLVFNMELNYPNGVFWSPADWAWVGGLLDLALPAWQHGQTVVSTSQRFTAEWAFEFMERHQVTHSFMTPTAVKRIAEISEPRKRWNLATRVICTGGESLPGEVLRWAEEEFGIVCNEFYGLTEFNHMVGCCKRLFSPIPGSMGLAFPGRNVAVIDEDGNRQPDGTAGEVASWLPDDPSLFLGYWGEPGVPERMRRGNWLCSGDLAVRDENGYFWYQGRNDDLI